MRKKTQLLTALFLVSTYMFSQNNGENKLEFKSISAGFGVCAGDINDGGMNFYIDATTGLKKNLFSVTLVAGGELQLGLGGSNTPKRDFKEFDLLYGREFKVYRFFRIETHSGLAVFNEVYRNGSTNYKEVSETVIGLPIRIKFLFYTSNHFALGFNPNAIINSVDTIYSGNLIFQYKL
jgi:hypothetical protein